MLFVQKKLKVKLSKNESEVNWPVSIISAESTQGKQNGTHEQSKMKISPYLNSWSKVGRGRLVGWFYFFFWLCFQPLSLFLPPSHLLQCPLTHLLGVDTTIQHVWQALSPRGNQARSQCVSTLKLVNCLQWPMVGEEKFSLEKRKSFSYHFEKPAVCIKQRWKHHSHQMLWCIWGPKAGKDINTPVYTWSLLWILTDNVVVGQRLSRMRAWWGDTRRRRVYDLALSDAMAVNGCFNLLRVISAECYNNIGLGSFSETYVKKINRGSLGDT